MSMSKISGVCVLAQTCMLSCTFPVERLVSLKKEFVFILNHQEERTVRSLNLYY